MNTNNTYGTKFYIMQEGNLYEGFKLNRNKEFIIHKLFMFNDKAFEDITNFYKNKIEDFKNYVSGKTSYFVNYETLELEKGIINFDFTQLEYQDKNYTITNITTTSINIGEDNFSYYKKNEFYYLNDNKIYLDKDEAEEILNNIKSKKDIEITNFIEYIKDETIFIINTDKKVIYKMDFQENSTEGVFQIIDDNRETEESNFVINNITNKSFNLKIIQSIDEYRVEKLKYYRVDNKYFINNQPLFKTQERAEEVLHKQIKYNEFKNKYKYFSNKKKKQKYTSNKKKYKKEEYYLNNSKKKEEYTSDKYKKKQKYTSDKYQNKNKYEPVSK